jgi:PAS domain S-box-containing protein
MTMTTAAFSDDTDHAEIRFLVEKNADGIIVVDDEGIILFANPATEQIFGRAPDSLVGSPVGIPLVTGETTEITIHKPGGARVDAEIRIVDTNWGQRPARLASVRDISARKAVEEQLRHSSKMEAIGRLTAGIAHDFNNLLTVVLGNLELARRQTEQKVVARILDNATRGARRAAILTERLLAFSRRKPLAPRPLHANALVAGMSDLLRRTLGETITVRTRLTDDLWLIEVDPTELETAVLNLAVNARDAMPDGGEVIIETANVELDEAYAAHDVEVKPGPYVLISVTDTGAGMPSEVLRQVFEPFFSTKADGRGTGLGLSQVYGFVKQSGGHVKLYSEPGRGTTAKIYLPRADAGTADQNPDIGERGGLVPGAIADETVLVVEDDDDVRSYTVDSLRNLGYRAFEAPDAAVALEILRREPAIRLLFTDLGLPGGTDGKALASQARLMRRDLPVLITTAYAGSALIHEGRLDRGVDLLSKPFTLSALANHVRQILDRNAGARTATPPSCGSQMPPKSNSDLS